MTRAAKHRLTFVFVLRTSDVGRAAITVILILLQKMMKYLAIYLWTAKPKNFREIPFEFVKSMKKFVKLKENCLQWFHEFFSFCKFWTELAHSKYEMKFAKQSFRFTYNCFVIIIQLRNSRSRSEASFTLVWLWLNFIYRFVNISFNEK